MNISWPDLHAVGGLRSGHDLYVLWENLQPTYSAAGNLTCTRPNPQAFICVFAWYETDLIMVSLLRTVGTKWVFHEATLLVNNMPGLFRRMDLPQGFIRREYLLLRYPWQHLPCCSRNYTRPNAVKCTRGHKRAESRIRATPVTTNESMAVMLWLCNHCSLGMLR